MPAHTDPYVFAAHLMYLSVAAVVATVLFVMVAMAPRKEREGIFNTWLVWSGPILLVQVAVTIAAVLFLIFHAITPEVFYLVIGQWLLVLLALAALPGGLLLARRARPRKTDWGTWILTVAVATILVLGLSLIWIVLVSQVVGESEPTFFDELVESVPGMMILVPIAILAAPVEEAIFRLGLQGQLQVLEKRGWCPMWATLVVPSAVWALGHAGVFQPHGIKEIQIFLVGLVLGMVYRRHGFGACVAVHLGLNCGALALVPLEMYLFRN